MACRGRIAHAQSQGSRGQTATEGRAGGRAWAGAGRQAEHAALLTQGEVLVGHGDEEGGDGARGGADGGVDRHCGGHLGVVAHAKSDGGSGAGVEPCIRPLQGGQQGRRELGLA